jgi:hypothetical protein
MTDKPLDPLKPHPMYSGEVIGMDPEERLFFEDDSGTGAIKAPIRFQLVKPSDESGKPRDQTNDAAEHMRYAASLGLTELKQAPLPRMGKAIIVGGAPSIKENLEKIRALAADPDNTLFAVNWSHTWLIQNNIVPGVCVFFEIDAEPDSTLKAAHPDVSYYICSHCHPKTFDELKNFKRILWHSPPNSEAERIVGDELFKGSNLVGGGVGTMTRTMTVALHLGYRNLELFGVDSSFPDDSKSTHVDGYETTAKPEVDGFYVYAKDNHTGKVRRFKTMGPLALQVEEFKEYCRVNHAVFALRVHGDGLLKYVHEHTYPSQYDAQG